MAELRPRFLGNIQIQSSISNVSDGLTHSLTASRPTEIHLWQQVVNSKLNNVMFVAPHLGHNDLIKQVPMIRVDGWQWSNRTVAGRLSWPPPTPSQGPWDSASRGPWACCSHLEGPWGLCLEPLGPSWPSKRDSCDPSCLYLEPKIVKHGPFCVIWTPFASSIATWWSILRRFIGPQAQKRLFSSINFNNSKNMHYCPLVAFSLLFGALFAHFWPPTRWCLDPFDSSWAPVVHSLGLLGPCWLHLERIWSPFGARVDQLRVPKAPWISIESPA